MEDNFQILGTYLTIRLPAEVDHHNSEELKRKADRLLMENNIHCIIFDFGRTNFMDSSGIGMIMGRYKNAAAYGGEVRVSNAPPMIDRMIKLAGVGRLNVL